MKLRDFRGLIANMPVDCQAFTTKKATWNTHIARQDRAGKVVEAIFGPFEKVTISRHDLRHYAAGLDLDTFVVATLLWGHPSGMRGNNVSRTADKFENLTAHLAETARTRSIGDWRSHYQQVRALSGVGLSTYTKFLAFLSVKIHSFTALILDDRIVSIISDNLFDELHALEGKRRHNPQGWYPEYLSCLDQLAGSLGVSSESVESFLFEFGLNLKESNTRFS
jgi:hypothetical protein